MGAFGSLLGIGNGNDKGGAQFQAASAGTAQQADLQKPVSTQQAQDSVTAATGALQQQQQQYGQQQALAQALQAQNGIGNQSSVFNQLQGVANGQGPNPAQAMLAQSTGANTANQAALMAGQRGAGANAGLIARQAAMQGGANQQNAAGQAATMQANQSLGALNQLGGIAGQQVGQQMNAVGANTAAAQGLTNSAQNNQGQMLGQVGAQNQAALTQANNTNQFNLGNTQSQNASNTAIAQGNQKAQADTLGGLTKGLGQMAMMLSKGGQVPHYAEGTPEVPVQPIQSQAPAPSAPVINPNGPRSSVGKILSGVISPKSDPSNQPAMTQGTGDIIGGLFGGAKSLFSPKAAQMDPASAASPESHSGADMIAAMGGDPYEQQAAMQSGPQSSAPGEDTSKMNVRRDMYDMGGPIAPQSERINYPEEKKDDSNPMAGLMAALAKGGKVPAMVSPGEVYLPPEEAKEVAKGKKSPMTGEMIKGKATVKGDSLKNDTVPKTLDAGGVVIPRSIIQGPNAHREAYKFVNAVMSKHGMKAKSKK